MSYEPREILRNILAEADFLVGIRATLTRERLEHDAILQRAVVRSGKVIDLVACEDAVRPEAREDFSDSEADAGGATDYQGDLTDQEARADDRGGRDIREAKANTEECEYRTATNHRRLR